MINILERLGIVSQETNRSFRTTPAVIMMLLMLTFVGTTFYILISSL